MNEGKDEGVRGGDKPGADVIDKAAADALWRLEGPPGKRKLIAPPPSRFTGLSKEDVYPIGVDGSVLPKPGGADQQAREKGYLEKATQQMGKGNIPGEAKE